MKSKRKIGGPREKHNCRVCDCRITATELLDCDGMCYWHFGLWKDTRVTPRRTATVKEPELPKALLDEFRMVAIGRKGEPKPKPENRNRAANLKTETATGFKTSNHSGVSR